MRTNTTHSVRALLRANSDGMDVGTIANTLNREPYNVRRILKTMPDAYIDRWFTTGRKKYYSAVWCVVVPPANCPKPNQKEST